MIWCKKNYGTYQIIFNKLKTYNIFNIVNFNFRTQLQKYGVLMEKKSKREKKESRKMKEQQADERKGQEIADEMERAEEVWGKWMR